MYIIRTVSVYWCFVPLPFKVSVSWCSDLPLPPPSSAASCCCFSLCCCQLEPALRRDRDDTLNGLGGGLLVYSRNGLTILPLKLQEDNGFHQHVCFKIITRGEPINIILAYRPPSSTKENFDKLLDLMRKMPRNTILIGDINVPGIDWSRNHATGARGR